ncbi:HAD superfamily phosphatase (TIGR01681 family)/FkbH-like protein [Lutibacter sp. Hel_I_33_5]|uniref:HAD-IIIC family phosphatase n=1 Tax=Lutibacter sp. Hel_I_33_5 TaxID=1566289 RepID=UPI0011ADC95B|nr:HAD-IIIC family phosphatase [Lutibacter sp. Hel_I_33_5]TVZ55440.1 HAD superfamily phosphatase (TIGR01681 family)/FkbH-like protein [Lutibacter sp. Hel_I_33_5]
MHIREVVCHAKKKIRIVYKEKIFMIISTFKELKKNLKKDLKALPTIKVALLGDNATQFLGIAIRGVGVERGYNIEFFEADYNQVEQQFLDPTSELYSFDADYVVVSQSTHKLLSTYNEKVAESQSLVADERLEFIKLMCNSILSRLIYFNYPEIEDNVFGSYANKVESSFTYQIRKLNYELMNLAQQNSNLFICDIAALQNKFGRDMMFNSSVYVTTEMIFSIDAIPYVASRAMDLISAAQGRFNKCLILDLDNTMWGGVIGDDGLENIQLGHGLGIGKAFTEFQEWMKKLKNRGVILAVCSKNTEKIAKEPFEKHPDMILKLSDIAVFKANWDNKADNIRQIQSILNIGFDSMVFLDDNPFERNMVRQNVPGITVPELPEDPGEYLEYLYSLNLFETVSYSYADVDRTKQYQVENQRVILQKSFTNEAEFLKSMDMVSEVKPFDKFNTPRVSQLSQRSNQFNLRNVRYLEADIENISNDDNFRDFSFTLSDKYGDNGLICVIILEKKNKETLFINTWFMSCRVLKRGMENFTLNTITKYAKENGFKKIIGEYIETPKNKMMKNHYHELGFLSIFTDDRNLYELDIANYTNKECFITTK